MNRGNRAIGRAWLIVVGVALIVAGAEAVAVWASPVAARGWMRSTGAAARALGGQSGSSALTAAWTLLIVGAIVAMVLAVIVLATRAGGRTERVLVDEDQTGQIPGVVRVDATAVQRALSVSLAELPQVGSLTVDVYRVRRAPVVRIRVRPRRGSEPRRIVADVESVVADLDAILGVRIPMLLHLARGGGDERPVRVR